MDYDLPGWLNLALRWLHVIAGVAWIGASFYFVWLDNNLRAPVPEKDGVKGELWAVHGGGFYHSQKYMVAPAHMPDHLHWFKWEAYTTWLSGFALLIVLYYWQAPVYLIDASKHAFSQPAAIVTGLAFIFGGLVVYEGLCRSPLGKKGIWFGIVWFGALTGAAYALPKLFSDRGAFIHVGAIIGTAMVANVFLVIIPNQRKIVADMLAGREVDPRLGLMGKQRSVHNTYMTLPVIFIMISNHYPLVTGHPLSWLLLAMISAGGISIRQFFLLKHHGKIRHDFLFYGAMLIFAATIVASMKPKTEVKVEGTVPFAVAQAIVQKHCVMCHAASPTHPGFSAPPLGVTFDTPDHIRTYAPKIRERAVTSTSMPLGNETGMTVEERAQLGAWINQGSHYPVTDAVLDANTKLESVIDSAGGAPRKRNAERTRKAILAAALREFAQAGFAGARIEKIVKAAKCNIRMLYHYFGDKKGLYMAVLESAYMDLRAREAELKIDFEKPLDGFLELQRFTFDYFEKNPRFEGLLRNENLQHGKFASQSRVVTETAFPLRRTIERLIKSGQDQGVFGPGLDPVQIYVTIAAMSRFHLANGYSLSATLDTDMSAPEWRRARLDHALALLEGYLTRGAR